MTARAAVLVLACALAARAGAQEPPSAHDLLERAAQGAESMPAPAGAPAAPVPAGAGPSRVYFFTGSPVPLPFAISTVEKIAAHVEALRAARGLDVRFESIR